MNKNPPDFLDSCILTSWYLLHVAILISYLLSSVQLLSRVLLFLTPCMDCSTPGFPCPSPTPRACSNSYSSSRWCHPTISFSVVAFSSCPQSFQASGSFPMTQFFTSGGQRIGVSASSSGPSNEYSGLDSFRMDWMDLLAVQRTLKSLLQHHRLKTSVLRCSAFFIV